MTFSIGTTPAGGSPAATASKTARKLPSGVRGDVAERGQDGILGERAGLAGVGDRQSGRAWRASLAGDVPGARDRAT